MISNETFYNELYDSSDEDNNDNEDHVCLITGEKLTFPSIKLSCGHAFNYVPLYNEVYNQKRCPIFLSYNTNKLLLNQMRCPYCRFVENHILPMPDEGIDGVEIVQGVTKPSKYALFQNKCNFKMKTGKRKGELCERKCMSSHCKYHLKYANGQSSTTTELCTAIIQRGPNKGKQCPNKPKMNGLCGKHSKQSI